MISISANAGVAVLCMLLAVHSIVHDHPLGAIYNAFMAAANMAWVTNYFARRIPRA